MKDKELLNIIFTYPHIKQKSWIFDADIDWNTVDIEIDNDNDNYIYWHYGIWNNGTWINGVWNDGLWKKGTWQSGTWIKGKIYNPETGKYQESTLPPNKCKWSTSYGR
jgi:hypothetical protein